MPFDVIAHLVRRIEELERRNANTHREGKIAEVDHDKGKVKVTDGIWTSGWLDWHEHNTPGGMKTRSMPDKDAGVVVKSVSGNMENGTVMTGAYVTSMSSLPEAKNGEHVTQMGADDPSKGKQVKTVTDKDGNHMVAATDSHTKMVGKYAHQMTKDGGHVLTTGGTMPDKPGDPVKNPDFTYKQTADGGHEITNKAGHSYKLDANGHTIQAGDFKYTMDPSGGHKITAGGHDINLTSAGLLINAATAFAKDYGVGSAPGAINKIDNAIDLT